MGTLPAVVPVVAISKGLLIGEVVVVVILAALLIAILVLNRRRKSSQKAAPAPSPQSYYADLQDSPPVEPPQQAPVQAPVQAPAQTSWADPLSVAAPASAAPAAQAAATAWRAAATAATRGRHSAARHAGWVAARAQRDARHPPLLGRQRLDPARRQAVLIAGGTAPFSRRPSTRPG